MSNRQLLSSVDEEEVEISTERRMSNCKSPSKKRYDDSISDEGVYTTSLTSLVSTTTATTTDIKMDIISAPFVQKIASETPESESIQNTRQARSARSSFASTINRYDEQPTLNDQSERYKSLFPEKWKHRLIEKRMSYERRLRIYTANPQVEIFYEKRLINEIQVKEKLKKKGQIEIPHFEIDLTFKPSLKMTSTPNPNTKRRMSVGVFSGHRRKSSACSMLSEDMPACDIIVKVKTVKNMPKQSATKRIFKEARVFCHLYPDHRVGGGVHKRATQTNYIPIKNSMGEFQHEFVFKGIPLRYCNDKYIMLELKGKAGNERVVVGASVLAGTSALIYTSTGSHRDPKPEETSSWTVAMEMMGTVTSVSANILNSEFDHISDSSNTANSLLIPDSTNLPSPKKSPKLLGKEKSIELQRAPTPRPIKKRSVTVPV